MWLQSWRTLIRQQRLELQTSLLIDCQSSRLRLAVVTFPTNDLSTCVLKAAEERERRVEPWVRVSLFASSITALTQLYLPGPIQARARKNKQPQSRRAQDIFANRCSDCRCCFNQQPWS